jgi:hypothetical protein
MERSHVFIFIYFLRVRMLIQFKLGKLIHFCVTAKTLQNIWSSGNVFACGAKVREIESR